MIIVPTIHGRLSNRLFHLGKIFAFCIEHRISLLYPPFYEFRNYFDLINHNKKSRLIIGNRFSYRSVLLLYRILCKLNIYSSPIHKIIRLTEIKEKFLLINEENINLINSRRFIFLDGWDFDSGDLLSKHKKELKILLNPVIHHSQKAEKIINSLRSKYDLLIGVHIRRGDYETFEGGKHFYDYTDYYRFISSCWRLVKNENPCFIITSNENCENKFQKDETIPIVYSIENQYIDSILLSLCDYIIGPPSTFSLWASYYNNTPMMMIKSKTDQIELSSFKTYEERHL